MNFVALVGRLTKDPEIRWTQGQNPLCVASFSVAVDRRVRRDGNQQAADFPNCVAFGKTAEFLEKYFSKGMRIGLTGRIQTRSYDGRDGRKVYVTEVVAENVEFVESKTARVQGAAPANIPDEIDGFMQIPDGFDEDLPFG